MREIPFRGAWIAILVCTLIALAGYFLPWVPHQAAGLRVVGLDLAEYVKFLPPQGQDGLGSARELFYLPLVAGSLSASLIATRRALPAALRGLSAIAAPPLALALLPPAWSLATLTDPAYRIQILGLAGCLLAWGLLLSLGRFLPNRPLLVLDALSALLAATWPAWRYLQVRPAIEAVYRAALPLGSGFWLTSAGFLALALVALSATLRRTPLPRWRS